MDTTFMSPENSKTSKPHVLIRFQKRWKKYCFIKSYYLLYMEKHKKSIH